MIEKLLEKLPVDKIYQDLFQPGMKKAGLTLETVLDLANGILLPIKLLNERSKVTFERNMRRYSEKLEDTADEDLSQVPEYVGLPILDKLTYLSDETLSEAFINLLTKASSNKTLQIVHPSFISTLNDLSKDEAKILFTLHDQEDIPFIDIYAYKHISGKTRPAHMDKPGPKTKEQLKDMIDQAFQKQNPVDIWLAWNLTAIERTVQLDFPENIDIYLYNLERNRIIQFERSKYRLDRQSEYEELQEVHYKDLVDGYTEWLSKYNREQNGESTMITLSVNKGMVQFTEYGKAFLAACIK